MGKFLDNLKNTVNQVVQTTTGSFGTKRTSEPVPAPTPTPTASFGTKRVTSPTPVLTRAQRVSQTEVPSLSKSQLQSGRFVQAGITKATEELITKPLLRAGASVALTPGVSGAVFGTKRRPTKIEASPLTKSIFGEGLTGEAPGEVLGLGQQTRRAAEGKGFAGGVTQFLSKKTGVKEQTLAPALIGLVTLGDLFPENPFKVGRALKGASLVDNVAKFGDEAVDILEAFKRGENIVDAKPELIDAVVREIEKSTGVRPNIAGLLKKIDDGQVATKSRPDVIGSVANDGSIGIRKPQNIQESLQLVGGEAEKKRLASINLDRVKAGEDVKSVISGVAEEFQEEFFKQTRGVISFDKATEMAKYVGLTADELVNLPKGTILNAETMEAARGILASSAEELSNAAKVVREGATPENMAKFQEVLNTHTDIQKAVTGVKAEIGRALGAQRKAVGATPESAQRVQDFFELQQRMQRATGTRNSIDAVQEFAEKLAQVSDDPAELSKLVAEMDKPSFLDKIIEFSVAAKLWTPTTHLVNGVSNSLASMMRPAEKTVAGGFDLINSALTGKKRERFIAEGMHDVVGSYSALTHGVGDALKEYINTLSFGEFFRKLEGSEGAVGDTIKALRREDFALDEINKGKEALPGKTGAIGTSPGSTGAARIFGKGVRLPFRALQAGDVFFKRMNQSAALHSLAFRQAVEEGLTGEARVKRIADLIRMPTDKMAEAAKAETLEFVFQSELGKAGQALSNARNQIPLSKFIIPFFNTPINVAKFFGQRGPVGLISPRNFKDFRKGGGATADAAARVAVGSTVTAATMAFIAQGNITGAAPSNAAERDKFYREGKMPYSIKVGDTWYQYQRLEPVASFFALAANIKDKMENADEETASALAGQFMGEVVQHMADQTFLVGFSDAIDAITDPERNAGRFIESLATGQVPSIIPFAARAIDRTVRDPEGIGEALQAKIPGLSTGVRSKLNVFGEEARRPGGFLNELSPIKTSKEKDDRVVLELDRLGINMGFPSETITVSGHKVKLTPDEAHQFVELTGRVTKKVIDTAMESGAWDEMSDDEREKFVDDVVSDTRKKVRDSMFVDAELGRLKYEASDNPVQQELLSEFFHKDQYSELTDEQRKKIIDLILERTGS